MRQSVLVWTVLTAAALLGAQPGLAQPPTRYPNPVFSPYLDLFRANPGPLPNYYQFVRPKQELLKTLQSQNTQLERQRASLGSLRQQVDIMERQPGAAPTGIGGGFMNYSHYYSTRQTPGPGAVRR
jgi:hypothetical protein